MGTLWIDRILYVLRTDSKYRYSYDPYVLRPSPRLSARDQGTLVRPFLRSQLTEMRAIPVGWCGYPMSTTEFPFLEVFKKPSIPILPSVGCAWIHFRRKHCTDLAIQKW